jgi:hypothetical protein
MMVLKALRVRLDLGQIDVNDTLPGNGGGGYPLRLGGEFPTHCRAKMGDLAQIGVFQLSRACPAYGIGPWAMRQTRHAQADGAS